MNEVRRYRNNLVSREDLGLWEGDIAPILDEAEEIDLHWKGGKIPARILWECLAWFRKVNEKFSSEAQARLGYNPTTKEWCWVAFPQYVVAGLYSKEIPSDELTEEQRAMRLRATKEMADGGFLEAGPIHMVLTAMVGFAGLNPTIHAIKAGKTMVGRCPGRPLGKLPLLRQGSPHRRRTSHGPVLRASEGPDRGETVHGHAMAVRELESAQKQWSQRIPNPLRLGGGGVGHDRTVWKTGTRPRFTPGGARGRHSRRAVLRVRLRCERHP